MRAFPFSQISDTAVQGMYGRQLLGERFQTLSTLREEVDFIEHQHRRGHLYPRHVRVLERLEVLSRRREKTGMRTSVVTCLCARQCVS